MHISLFFFFTDTATTEIYTLSLHDALPIFASFSSCRYADQRRAISVSSSTCSSACWRRGRSQSATGLRTPARSEEHTSELQSHSDIVCRLLLEKKKKRKVYSDAQLQLSLHI